jgi:hypothetical protein
MRRASARALGLALLALLGARAARAEAPKPKEDKLIVAFVLLAEAKLPKEDAILRAFPAYALEGQVLRKVPDEKNAKPKQNEKKGGGEALVVDAGGSDVAVMLMPTPFRTERPTRRRATASRRSTGSGSCRRTRPTSS